MSRRGAAAAALTALMLTASAPPACGGDSGDDELVVFAAASLAPALERFADDYEGVEVRLSFAGSDELAAQIRQGLTPDVYAAANTELPMRLAADGLLSVPTTFAANELVVAVPAGSEISSVAELEPPGVALGIGDEDVPVGSYTREVLAGLGGQAEAAILANVRTSEPDVSGIVGKLSQGAIEAGFVYASDVAASGGALEAIALPSRLRPAVAYGAGVPVDAEHPEEGERFIAGLLAGPGAAALREGGFLPPPGAGAEW